MATDRAGTLAPDLSAFLTQLSVTLHKHRAYPAGHPMRRESTGAIHRFVLAALGDRESLRIGVARHHLLIDDESSDPAHPVLRELAERLHRRQIGSIVLSKGVGPDEIEAALERMNADPRRNSGGTEAAGPERIGDHVEILPLWYTSLALAGQGEAPLVEEADARWAELARMTAAPEVALGGGGARAIAEAIVDLRADPERRAAVMGILERFGRAAARDAGPQGQVARRELRNLLDGIPREALSGLLGIGPEHPGAAKHLLTASDWLAIPTLIDLVEAAAAASGQSVSHFLLRLLRKLGGRASQGGDADTEQGVREAIQGLLKGWSLADPNPAAHTVLLEALSRRDRSGPDPSGERLAEPERLVRMSLEVGVAGPLILGAVDSMIETGQLQRLLDLIDLPDTNAAAREIWAHLITPASLRSVLLEEPVDQNACVRLLARVPLESAEGLLDSLTISESQNTRWLILRRLAEMGPAVGQLLVARLDQAPWYLRRNLLGLLADLPDLPAGFSARRYADEEEPMLRLEALRLMLRSEADREDALHRTLADSDDRVVRLGLEAGAGRGLSRASLPRLMKLLNDGSRPAELRARGVALLAQFESPAVRQWVIGRVLVRRGFFRRTRLAPKSPDLVAGIGILARCFPQHPQTVEVVRLAAASGDADLIAAAGGGKPA